MLTIEELAEIGTRAEAATPGPWTRAPMDCGDYVGEHIQAPSGTVTGESRIGVADSIFIAHARSDIPRLLAHIAKLEAERDEALKALAAEEGKPEGAPSEGWRHGPRGLWMKQTGGRRWMSARLDDRQLGESAWQWRIYYVPPCGPEEDLAMGGASTARAAMLAADEAIRS